jgi:Dullard-like phosphatase family protein
MSAEPADGHLEDLLRAENQIIAHADTRFEEPCCWCCLRHFQRPIAHSVLPQPAAQQKILVLDLDETLVHCSFYPPPYHDFTVSLSIESQVSDVYIQKRPNVDEFIAEVFRLFYIVIFTASLEPYANPIIDRICPDLPRQQRLFREDCTFRDGYFVKDLSIFGAPLEHVLIVDNNPGSFFLHPQNAILSRTWEGDRTDTELMDYILPLLRECVPADDVVPVLARRRKEVQP